MKKTLFIFTFAACCFISGIAQTTPAGTSEVNITNQKFVLPNGLTVLVHEDHSDPIVYVDVTYHVGSAREQQGRSGFAHFFEHMMFQGSKHVGDDQHFKIVTEAGGTMNGTTNSDRTNYYETGPANQLEKILWLESDRMGFLLDSVTQRKFEVQRSTVINERGQRYDNAPYGLVGEKIGEALYPQGHPYSTTTIGYIEDLKRADVNDLKRFYMRWYGPNNAVLTIAGDVKTAEAMKLVERYFGSIKKGPEVTAQKITPFKLESTRYISYEDNIKFPQVNYAYPSADINSKDDAALDVLATILSGSQGSPLYKGFIESGKAVAANAFQYSRELAGQFQITIRANNPDRLLADIDRDLAEILKKWEAKGVTDDDLSKYKAQYQSDLYNRLSTVQGKGGTLASNFTFYGDADYLRHEIERYMSVSKEDVMRVYETYIKNKPAVILSCLPKGKVELKVQPDNWKMPERTIETESAEYKKLKYEEPKDIFNRSKMPLAPGMRQWRAPGYMDVKLLGNSNIPIIMVSNNEIPKVSILVTFRSGHRFEAKEKSGLAELTAAMLGKSTLKTKADEIENKLDRMGSSVNFSAGDEDITISIQCLKQNLEATIKIVNESLYEPLFDNAEFEIEKKRQMDRIAQLPNNAAATADIAYKKVLYGTEHIMSYPSIGTTETVGKLQVQDVKDYYEKMKSNLYHVVAIGEMVRPEAEKNLEFLSKLQVTPKVDVVEPEIPKIDKTRIYFVDKKNAAQSEIRVGHMGVPFIAAPMYQKCVILNFSFAGSFNSRLNSSLRELKGWTYGVRGSFSGTKFAGPYTISGGFKANATDSTITEIFKELKKYADKGMTDDELQFTKLSIYQSEALKYESPNQKLAFLKKVMDFNLPRNFMEEQNNVLKTVTKQDLNSIARFRLPYNNMIIVVVGDKATNLDKVKKLGYEVVEMDVNGKLIN
ncbi:MAG: pitrilysin family protein [Bacteroidota bacterium]